MTDKVHDFPQRGKFLFYGFKIIEGNSWAVWKLFVVTVFLGGF